MRAMVLTEIHQPLQLVESPDPLPRPGEVRLKVETCGVCRTDLHVVDGELPEVRPPVVPGHEVVGRIDMVADAVEGFALGDRVGPPPAPLDAAILFAPDGALVPQALRVVRKGGRVVCGGIHMSDIPSFPYAWLWEERQLMSVANLTRADAAEFFALAGKARVVTSTTPYPLEQANRALSDLRAGRIHGAAVLVC